MISNAALVHPYAKFSTADEWRRFAYVKDRGPDGSFADLGTGDIDFPRIFSHGREAGVIEYIVERDSEPHPLDTARVGYDYLRDVRFRTC
ncbi:MAG: sugar phosphate isomerase [Streptosporangiaceae bacterium]|nr:sugar phosphate isomerase [Streptosporangiaceae bacterium]